jgi:hypothetical protein
VDSEWFRKLTSLTSSERLRGGSAVPLPLACDTVILYEIREIHTVDYGVQSLYKQE